MGGVKFRRRLRPAPVQGGSGAILTAADITYVGAIRMPDNSIPGTCPDTASTSTYGSISGRVVAGRTHVFLYDQIASNPPNVWELDITGLSPSQDYHSAPRAVYVRNWGNIYGNARKDWFSDGTPRDISGNVAGQVGLHWHEALQQLYWSQLTFYNVSDPHDWTVGMSVLHGDGTVDAYGPWRFVSTDADGRIWKGARTHFFFEHPNGQMLTGGISSSGDANIAWGPSCFGTVNWPLTTTPSGSDNGGANTAADILLPDRYLNYHIMNGQDAINAGHYLNRDGSMNGTIRAFQLDGTLTYPIEIFHGHDNVQNRVDPALNGGKGTWSGATSSTLDAFWFEGTNKRGVVFVGVIAAGYSTDPSEPTACHEWYYQQGQLGLQLTGLTGTVQNSDTATGGMSGKTGTVTGVQEQSLNGWIGLAQSIPGGTDPHLQDFTIGETVTFSPSGAHGTVSTQKRHDTCAHGFGCIQCASAGDSLRKSVPAIMIFDPDRLTSNKATVASAGQVISGSTLDYTTEATAIIDPELTYGIRVAEQNSAQAKQLSGCWRIPNTNRFLVIAPAADNSRVGDAVKESLIHVFDINDT